jgi:branched-chain amino acid transport system permease protein
MATTHPASCASLPTDSAGSRRPGPKALAFVLVMLLFLAAPWLVVNSLGSTYVVELLVQGMIYGILALSLNLLLGYTGLPSLGHTVYLGIGAYAVAICISKFQLSPFTASIVALLASTVAGALFGLFALRTRGVYFLMITLALAMLVWGLAYRWVDMTAGDNGISGILRPAIGPWSLQSITSYYYFVLIVFCVSVFLMFRLVRSPFGLTLVGIRESESRMRTLGYDVWLHKYICFVIASFFGGVSGVLVIFYNGFISPTTLEVISNMETLLMVALGGPGTILGPFIGALIIVMLKNFVSVYTGRWLMILGAIYIVTILYAPKGLVEFAVRQRRKDISRPAEVSR